MKRQIYSSLHHQLFVKYEHRTDILHQIVSPFNPDIISVYHNFTISPFCHNTILKFHRFTITTFHHINVSPINNFNNARLLSNYAGHCQQFNITRITNVKFLHVIFQFLENGIERIHISMRFATNNSDIYRLTF